MSKKTPLKSKLQNASPASCLKIIQSTQFCPVKSVAHDRGVNVASGLTHFQGLVKGDAFEGTWSTLRRIVSWPFWAMIKDLWKIVPRWLLRRETARLAFHLAGGWVKTDFLHLNHLLSQAPALFFHFSWTDPAPCLSKNGRGRVFLRATIFQRSLLDAFIRWNVWNLISQKVRYEEINISNLTSWILFQSMIMFVYSNPVFERFCFGSGIDENDRPFFCRIDHCGNNWSYVIVPAFNCSRRGIEMSIRDIPRFLICSISRRVWRLWPLKSWCEHFEAKFTWDVNSGRHHALGWNGEMG
jgi:hypothetical protein